LRDGGYAVSAYPKAHREAFGQEKTRFRGRRRVGWAFTFAAAAYNLVRLPEAHLSSEIFSPRSASRCWGRSVMG
jgi:hypothetical protein